MHLLALFSTLAVALAAMTAATLGADGRTRNAPVPVRIKRRRPDGR